MDNSRENTNITTALIKLYNIKRVIAFAYYLLVQGLIERGHKPIVDTLAKINGL